MSYGSTASSTPLLLVSAGYTTKSSSSTPSYPPILQLLSLVELLRRGSGERVSVVSTLPAAGVILLNPCRMLPTGRADLARSRYRSLLLELAPSALRDGDGECCGRMNRYARSTDLERGE